MQDFLKVCKENDYNKVEKFIETLMYEAYSASQIIEQLNDYIIETDELTNKQKVSIGEKLGVSSPYTFRNLAFIFGLY